MSISSRLSFYVKLIVVKLLYVISFTGLILSGCSENPLGNTDIGADFVASAPILTTVSNLNFPTNSILVNTATPTINVDNSNTSSDASMSYSCLFDRAVDSSVSGNDCSTLPGTVNFSATAGTLNWTPDATAYGPYEIKITGSHINGKTDDETFVIDVQQAYTSTNLLLNIDGQFADLTGQGNNTPFTSPWKNLVSSGSGLDDVLTNFDETPSSGWTGNGAALPYALAFAAGAMIFIVVEEVIPESQSGGNTDLATIGLIAGFIVMMVLDVALG